MTRLLRAWGGLRSEQRIASLAALALLVTMFFPWYELQSLNRKTGAIDSRSISAFGDVSFVEAAVFLVAAGVVALMFARAERRDFHMPGSDGGVVMLAGCWAALLIFYRVFSRPAGHGYPVGIQWGFFLAFVAAGALGYAGWRMRAADAPETPLVRPRTRRPVEEDVTVLAPPPRRAERTRPVAAPVSQTPMENTDVLEHSAQPPPRTTPSPLSSKDLPATSPPRPAPRAPGSRPLSTPKRPRFPPSPSDQLSFEDQPPEREKR
jgi:hypothetical protein